MSALSVPNESATSQNIPVRTVVINDPNQLPLNYGTTPGGTLFSTTPGGTRVVYERKFLLHCRTSPHSMSPPCNLPTIPGVTEPEPEQAKSQSIKEEPTPKENVAPRKSAERDELFDMDM